MLNLGCILISDLIVTNLFMHSLNCHHNYVATYTYVALTVCFMHMTISKHQISTRQAHWNVLNTRNSTRGRENPQHVLIQHFCQDM